MSGPNKPPRFQTGLGDVMTLDHKPWRGENTGFAIGDPVQFGLRINGQVIGRQKGYVAFVKGHVSGFGTISGRRVINVQVESQDQNVPSGQYQFRELRRGWMCVLEGATDPEGRLYLRLVNDPIDIKN